MRKAWMLCRWMLILAGLTLIHAVTSFVACFFAYVAWESGPRWLENPLVWSFFFPFVCLSKAGVVTGTFDDSPENLVINSVCWVAVVYPVWLLGHQLRSKLLITTPLFGSSRRIRPRRG